MLMLSIRRHFESARSVRAKKKVALENTFPLTARGSRRGKKSSKRFASKIMRRRIWKLAGEEVHRRSCYENFPTDVRGRLYEEEFGSWRRSPSKIAPRKFPNRYASKIIRRRIWQLAKKSIKDRSTKNSNRLWYA